LDIVKNNRRGTWNVPYISQAYLVQGTLIKKNLHLKETENNEIDETSSATSSQFLTFARSGLDSDMAFTSSLRNTGHFFYVSNEVDFGHLVSVDNFVTENRTHPELYEIFENPVEWERRYIHTNWSQLFNDSTIIEQPCPDVFWFPVLSEEFTKALVHTMESFGQWSDGTNNDERLNTGYEAVPTRDIHMNQVGLEATWLQFLRDYIRPIQEKLFVGYFHDPPKSIMNFVVRYAPHEQPELRPHHDSSTYTINVALNRPHEDYEGGGCRFIRQNCSVTNARVGWSLIHPGRLTHYHEGLRVTKGVRYIMISFVDP